MIKNLGNGSSSGGGTVTAVTGSAGVASSGGTTPNLTIDATYSTPWTASQSVTLAPGANATADGEVLQNTTAATTGNQQFSPRLRLSGTGFASTGGTSQTDDWVIYCQPVQGTTNSTSILRISSQINGGGYLNQINVTSNGGGVVLAGALSVAGGIDINVLGQGLAVKEGANAKQGVATLAAGTVVVSNTSTTASSRIQLTAQSLGTVSTPQALAVSARTAGTSFTILSASASDTSVVAYEIFEPG